MNETERIKYKLNGDEDSNKYVTVIDMAIKALEEYLCGQRK